MASIGVVIFSTDAKTTAVALGVCRVPAAALSRGFTVAGRRRNLRAATGACDAWRTRVAGCWLSRGHAAGHRSANTPMVGNQRVNTKGGSCRTRRCIKLQSLHDKVLAMWFEFLVRSWESEIRQGASRFDVLDSLVAKTGPDESRNPGIG